jgi:hypothetical protein
LISTAERILNIPSVHYSNRILLKGIIFCFISFLKFLNIRVLDISPFYYSRFFVTIEIGAIFVTLFVVAFKDNFSSIRCARNIKDLTCKFNDLRQLGSSVITLLFV